MSDSPCDNETSTYNKCTGLHYQPSLVGNAIFLAIFLFCLLGQTYLLLFKRLGAYNIVLGIAFFVEILGYAGRIMLHGDQHDSSGYIMEIIRLTIAPNFLSGVLYISLSRFILTLGRQYSSIPPSVISWFFILGDFLSLCAIGVGGSLAAIHAPSLLGVWIMIGGLAGQCLSTLLFTILATDFWLRRERNRRAEAVDLFREQRRYLGDSCPPAAKQFAAVIGFSSACMLVRGGYRVAELSKGFNGPLAQEEIPLFLLDSLPVSLAALMLTLLSPHPDLWFVQKELARRVSV